MTEPASLQRSARLRRRLANLAKVELVNVVLFPGAVLYILRPWVPPFSPLVLAGAGCAALSLAVGTVVLWLRSKGHLPFRSAYRLVRAFDVIGVLSVATFGLAVASPGFGTAWPTAITAAGLALFGCAEVVNYRWVQISAGGWKALLRGRTVRPQLAREFGRGEPSR